MSKITTHHAGGPDSLANLTPERAAEISAANEAVEVDWLYEDENLTVIAVTDARTANTRYEVEVYGERVTVVASLKRGEARRLAAALIKATA